MSDSNIQVTDDMAERYARAKGVSISEAKEKLKANFEAELKDVDARQIYVKLMKAYREMAPKLEGVVLRESDMHNRIKALSSEVSSLKSQLAALEDKLDMHKNTFNKALAVLNDIVKEDSKTLDRIKSLEQPFYKRIWNKIKCLLKI